jgi:hypothetical protein
MKDLGRVIFFGFIAILMLSELLTSNLYSLIGPLDATAEIMGISVSAERNRLIILIILDLIPGVGAVLAVRGLRNSRAARIGGTGVILTTIGMLAYGGYQFWAATYLLGEMLAFVKAVGVVYAALGVIAWFVGVDLRRARSSA